MRTVTCRSNEGVPTDDKVAEIFEAIPLFPPHITTFDLFSIDLTARSKG